MRLCQERPGQRVLTAVKKNLARCCLACCQCSLENRGVDPVECIQARADMTSQDVQVLDEVIEIGDRVRLEQQEIPRVEDRCGQQPVHLLHKQRRVRCQALKSRVQVLAQCINTLTVRLRHAQHADELA